jgi:hypothetical protein
MKFYNFRRKILNDGMNEEARVATFHLSHNPRFSFFVGYIGTPRRKRYTDCLDFRSASPSTNASVESEARNRQRKAKVHIVIEIINSVHHLMIGPCQSCLAELIEVTWGVHIHGQCLEERDLRHLGA